jgi:hypothetical protein
MDPQLFHTTVGWGTVQASRSQLACLSRVSLASFASLAVRAFL